VSTVDLEQLTAALAQHDADPDAVMAAFRGKRRHARNRNLATGGLAAAAIVAVVAVLQPWATPSNGPVNPPAATGCAVVSLRQTLAEARQLGASVIVATGSLTGKTAANGEIYYQMILRSVQTLSGPAITSGSTGWIGSQRGPAGLIPGADAGALWATNGRLFAIASTARQAGTAVGPVLRIAPVVHDQVIFSSAGCWDTAGLPSQPYHGPLAETPGSSSYARAAPNGFHAVPLTTVKQIAAG
jgi:hypothetical protein